MAKTYLVVGGTSGIGNKIVEKLAQEGHHIIVASREERNLENFDNVTFKQVDITEEFELKLDQALDGVVYCPGSIQLKPFNRLKIADFESDMQINAFGAVKIIQSVLSNLQQSDQASIVLFSTVATSVGLSFHSSIAMAKGAVEGLAVSLASELAPKIRVNVIAPSLIDTPLASKLLSTDEKRDANAERHPLKRIGKTDDIADAAIYLLSEKSSWVSGQVFNIDGGMSKLK